MLHVPNAHFRMGQMKGKKSIFRTIFCLCRFVFFARICCFFRLSTDIQYSCARFMAINIIYTCIKKTNNSISISYINNDSNNNNKIANIFYQLYSIWVDVFALSFFWVWISRFFRSAIPSLSLSLSLIIHLTLSLYQFEDLNSENAFYIAILRRFICAMFSHASSLSLCDLFFN